MSGCALPIGPPRYIAWRMPELVLDGYTDLPADHVAAVATFLEMRLPAAPRAPALADPPVLLRVTEPDPEVYRDLFRRVGADWLWNSRLRFDDARLRATLADPAVELYMPMRGGKAVGILELDFRDMPSVELAFFGVVPEVMGGGVGRWLMDRAIELAFRPGVGRFWLHTCTFDHPAALPFYLRSGFVPYARKIEMFPDPRLTGVLPREAAPHVPVIG
jgi:GNAT superfamily N-acetyltransferase